MGRLAGAWSYAWGVTVALGHLFILSDPSNYFSLTPSYKKVISDSLLSLYFAEKILLARVPSVAREAGAGDSLKVLVYSSNRNTRADVLMALGPRPSMSLPIVEYTQVATEPAFISAADNGKFDLFILDGGSDPCRRNGACPPD